ncbi:MAG: hypothetical protein NTX50_19625 [Candidatus Sumerlaeota bacterium]|nr:hypothetical protein [Candidatus Sumerlaeota bacterium]
MTHAAHDLRTEQIRRKARHVLFVEGEGPNSVDIQVLDLLLRPSISVEPLGSSFHIRSAAQALYRYHPDYYFLIDRDHYEDEFVEKCWDNFPAPETPNLLIWRKREIENYFLASDYLLQSKYCVAGEQKLRSVITKHASARLFLDTANQVIIEIRERLKQNWIQLFENPAQFKTKNEALSLLTRRPEWEHFQSRVSQSLIEKNISTRFEELLEEWSGGLDRLEFGTGQWIERLRGRMILSSVIHECFQVRDAKGSLIQGEDKLNAVVKDLARLPLTKLPDDFQLLHKIIMDRINAS